MIQRFASTLADAEHMDHDGIHCLQEDGRMETSSAEGAPCDENRIRTQLEDVCVRDMYAKRDRGALSRDFTRCFHLLSPMLDGAAGQPFKDPTYREIPLCALCRAAKRADSNHTRSAFRQAALLAYTAVAACMLLPPRHWTRSRVCRFTLRLLAWFAFDLGLEVHDVRGEWFRRNERRIVEEREPALDEGGGSATESDAEA